MEMNPAFSPTVAMNNKTNQKSTSEEPVTQLPLSETELFQLTEEQQEVFMEVIGSALNIKHKTQLFRWTQSIFQYLIGHDVLIYAIKSSPEQYYFQYLTSSRYFGQEQLNEVIADNGLISDAIKQWQKNRIPLFITNSLKQGSFKSYEVINADEVILQSSELKHVIMHGFSNQSSIIAFGRLHKDPSPAMAHIVELLMPYLHNIISNLSHDEAGNPLDEKQVNYKKLSRRESEIIKWVHHSKTNREISEQLNISPLTVKNHVQNIIKKLGVQNRRQAAAKAYKLGMFEVS